MPKKKIEKVHINITIDEDLNKWEGKMASELRMNKSQLINNLISIGKDDVNLLKGMGLLGLAKTVKKVREGGLKMRKKGVVFGVNG